MTFVAGLLWTGFMGVFLMFAEQAKISFGIYDIAKSLTIPGWVVIATLLVQSVYMIAVGIERWLTYNKARQQSRQYAPKVAMALKNSNIDEAISISDKHKDSHLAMVVSSGLKEFAAHQGNTDISADEMEASKRALERAIAVKTAELKRGLAGLATVGSTAPFVGLFGTVVGIIGAFIALAQAENAGIGAVGAAIALVSGRVDKIFDFSVLGREAALAQAKQEARQAALAAGAAADAIEVVDVVELPMTHMRTGAVQVKVRAIGPLAAA